MKRTLVLDASIALRTHFPAEPGHAETAETFSRLAARGFEPCVPDLFAYEVGNALQRGTGEGAERRRILLDILKSVRVVPLEPFELMDTLELATSEGLTFYDAAYLALSRKLDARLWTADARLLAAADARGVATEDLNNLSSGG